MSATQQFCTFYLDGLFFGVEVEKVQEVIRHQHTTKVPLASAVIGGLINLRGQIVTAVNLRRKLELPDTRKTQESMNVVIRGDEGAISLLVDEIGDVVEVEETEFERPPDTLRGTGRELILGAFKLKSKLLLLLDTDKAMKLA
jgi:purine-binding chemotaxis protein CheW